MGTKHTPRPWNACLDGACPCNVVSCATHPIAIVTSGNWGDTYPALRFVGSSSLDQKAEPYIDMIVYGEVPREEAAANARLIAASPDLLHEHEVREGDLVMLRKAVEAGDPKRELLVRIDDMLRETRAAIAKATGEAS